MTVHFLTILNMSITATAAAAFVLIFRGLAGKKLPKQFSYALWLIVLLRLIMPFSFPSSLSVLDKVNPHVGQPGAAFEQTYFTSGLSDGLWAAQGTPDPQSVPDGDPFSPPENSAVDGLTGTISLGLPAAKPETDNSLLPEPAPPFLTACAFLWIAGAAGLLAYSVFSYLKLMRNMRTATLLREDGLVEECCSQIRLKPIPSVYVSDRAEGPFLCGVFRPRIILPAFLFSGVRNEDAVRSVLLHEMVHIKRLDFIWKPLAFAALILHWFNPVMWLCFFLADRDMEMSCDETVVRQTPPDRRAAYARTLLELAMKQNGHSAGGLPAFGESSVGARIKNILAFKTPKKPAAAVSVILLLLCGVFLLSDPPVGQKPAGEGINVLFMGGLEKSQEQSFQADTFILVGYEPQSRSLDILPIPRDLGILTGDKTVKLSRFSFEHTPEQTLEEVNRLLGVQVSRYVEFDMQAFRDFIDAIGGLEYDVPSAMYYDDPAQDLHIALDQGRQVLDGSKAEMLVRYRPRGRAATRMDNQSQFLSALLTRRDGVDLFQNAGALYDLISAHIRTNIGADELGQYFLALRKVSPRPEDIAIMELPVTQTQSGLFFLEIDSGQTQELLKDKFK